MLMVACREIISGDSGFSVEKSIVLGSGCSLGTSVSHAKWTHVLSMPYGSSGRSTGGSTSLVFFSADFGFVSSISSCSDTLSSSRWSWSDSDSMLGGCSRGCADSFCGLNIAGLEVVRMGVLRRRVCSFRYRFPHARKMAAVDSRKVRGAVARPIGVSDPPPAEPHKTFSARASPFFFIIEQRKF